MKPAAPAPVLIEFQGATLGYGRTAVLRDVNCKILLNESVGLVGPNGSGKTTFLKAVLSLLAPVKGKINVDRSLRFAYVPQADSWNFSWPLTVRESVYLAARSKHPFGKIRDDEEDNAQAAIKTAGLASIADRLVTEISGGQRQRTILAQALSQRPDVLLLDEPARGLDVAAEHELLMLIDELRASERMTILLVAHTLHIPLNHCDKVLLFTGNEVVETTPDELVHTKKLQQLYGMPFVLEERQGKRWAAPSGKK